MNGVTVSIVCTNYNKGAWVQDAIESFLAQKTSFEYEIIIVDDKSTDGSQNIIREYARKYPDKIRSYFNKSNIGITKTWISICKEAKGQYIARCDGDDYWTDNQKLQKQVDMLERTKNSKWCTTDYDIVTPKGETIHKSVLESGLGSRPDSYAETIATKGMTMASTWLIDANLMREVNNEIDSSAVDDTFNIQLDLFNKTIITYLPESTVAYRSNEGSDSKPVDIEVAKLRDERLYKTQLEYLKKYKNVDYEKIIKHAFKIGIIADDRLRLINRQRTLIEGQGGAIDEMNNIIKLQEKQISDILSSKKYRIGKAITEPVTVIKSLYKRKKRS